MSGLPVFKDVVRTVSNQMRAMRQTQPDLMTAFSQLASAGTKDGALDKKTPELLRWALPCLPGAMTVLASMSRR